MSKERNRGYFDKTTVWANSISMSRFDRNQLVRMFWDMNASRRQFDRMFYMKRKASPVFPDILRRVLIMWMRLCL